ncbi:MAG: M24 family metallopeptidase [Alphaproteobacteria bacterium]
MPDDRSLKPIDYAERRASALRLCLEHGLDALLVGAMGSGLGINTQAQGYMRFLAGWDSVDTPSLLFLHPDRRPLLLVASPHMQKMASQVLAGIDVALAAPEDFGARLATALAGVSAVGLCGCDELPLRVWAGIEPVLPPNRDSQAAACIAPLRLVKDDAQLERHRRGAAICDRMFARVGEIELIGRPSFAIKADLDHVALAAGVDGLRSWLTVGRSIDYPRYFAAENRQVAAAGDLLLFGMMLTVDGLWTHAVRSFHLGLATDHAHRVQNAVVTFQRETADAMRHGADLAQVARNAYAAVEGLYDVIGTRDVRLLRLAHGLGYAYADPIVSDAFPRSFQAPDLNATPVRLRSGMVFELHPLLMFEGGGAGVGDTLVVGPQGGTFLTAFPRGLQELAI